MPTRIKGLRTRPGATSDGLVDRLRKLLTRAQALHRAALRCGEHRALPRDEAARVGLLYEGVEVAMRQLEATERAVRQLPPPGP